MLTTFHPELSQKVPSPMHLKFAELIAKAKEHTVRLTTMRS